MKTNAAIALQEDRTIFKMDGSVRQGDVMSHKLFTNQYMLRNKRGSLQSNLRNMQMNMSNLGGL